MKKLLFLIPFVLFSCKKEASVETSTNSDSVIATDQTTVVNPVDTLSLKDSTVVENPKTENTTTSSDVRTIDGNKIIHTIDGSKIPMKISDEFTRNEQQLIIKVKDFKGKKISGNIFPENEMMNIRFNQIKLADGGFDGPFGREISYDIKKPGEIWLLISKSNMASGEVTGKFKVNIK